MSEYLIQGETLTGIADKIRPLLGLTGTMTLEQMQTHLTTEQANITAALAAIAKKGVSVPAYANSNALAALIGAIESSLLVESGTITLLEDRSASSNEPLDLGYSTEDRFPVLIAINGSPNTTYSVKNIITLYGFNGTEYGPNIWFVANGFGGSTSSTNKESYQGNGAIRGLKNSPLDGADTWSFMPTPATYLRAGITYRWLVLSAREGDVIEI